MFPNDAPIGKIRSKEGSALGYFYFAFNFD